MMLGNEEKNTHSITNFTMDGTEKTIQDILSKLKFVSKIQKGYKVNVKELSFNNNNFLEWIKRKWYGETKEDTLKFVEDLYDLSFKTIINFKKRDELFYRNMSNNILNALQDSKEGIHSLIETYKEDVMFVSRIEALESTLDTKINMLNNY